MVCTKLREGDLQREPANLATDRVRLMRVEYRLRRDAGQGKMRRRRDAPHLETLYKSTVKTNLFKTNKNCPK